jgi:hypothetical protein
MDFLFSEEQLMINHRSCASSWRLWVLKGISCRKVNAGRKSDPNVRRDRRGAAHGYR